MIVLEGVAALAKSKTSRETSVPFRLNSKSLYALRSPTLAEIPSPLQRQHLLDGSITCMDESFRAFGIHRRRLNWIIKFDRLHSSECDFDNRAARVLLRLHHLGHCICSSLSRYGERLVVRELLHFLRMIGPERRLDQAVEGAAVSYHSPNACFPPHSLDRQESLCHIPGTDTNNLDALVFIRHRHTLCKSHKSMLRRTVHHRRIRGPQPGYRCDHQHNTRLVPSQYSPDGDSCQLQHMRDVDVEGPIALIFRIVPEI